MMTRSETQKAGLARFFLISSKLWIIGPTRDLIFFILTPLLIVPLIFAVKDRFPAETLGVYVLGFGGFGHHLPGFIRAYSDRDLFKQYKLRFTAIPLLLILICGLYSFLNLNALACATVAWGTWHGAMQINGFVRIYDSKVESFSAMTARLDWLMCLSWFGLAILHSPVKLFSLITQFYVSGGFLIAPAAFAVFRWAWDFSTILITLLFLFHSVRQWKSGSSPSPVKMLVMASSFAFWWWCVVSLNNLILGVVLWEIFHDIQYNVLVWFFQRQRVDANLNTSSVENILFKPGWGRLALYSFLILAYGYIGVVTSYADINTPEKMLLHTGAPQWLLRIFLASAILHFYFDGFIWRVRQKKIRQGLGLEEVRNLASEPIPSETFWKHGWKWIFFVIPVAAMGTIQYRGWSPDFKSQAMNLSETIPGSWLAHFFAAGYYKEQGLFDRAVQQYQMAVKYNPDFAIGHLFLGDLLYKRGDLNQAAEHYQRAVDLDTSDMAARKSLAFLYLKLDQPFLATGQFQKMLEAEPDNADLTFGMASSLLRQSRLEEAEVYAGKTLQLFPNHSGALNSLGMIQQFRGNLPGAIAYYEKALASDSANASARQNLTEALAKTKNQGL